MPPLLLFVSSPCPFCRKDLIYERENYLLKGPNVITINSFSNILGQEMALRAVNELYYKYKVIVL